MKPFIIIIKLLFLITAVPTLALFFILSENMNQLAVLSVIPFVILTLIMLFTKHITNSMILAPITLGITSIVFAISPMLYSFTLITILKDNEPLKLIDYMDITTTMGSIGTIISFFWLLIAAQVQMMKSSKSNALQHYNLKKEIVNKA